MKSNYRDIDKVDHTRRILKQMLWALHISEGFGEQRLMRVLATWSEVYKTVEKDPTNEMLVLDDYLDEVCPTKRLTRAIGKEKF